MELISLIEREFGKDSEECRRANQKLFYSWRNMAAIYMNNYDKLVDGDVTFQQDLAQAFKRIDVTHLSKSERVKFLNLSNSKLLLSLFSMKYAPQWLAEKVMQQGGEIHMKSKVVGVNRSADGKRVESVVVDRGNSTETIPCDYFLSTMPVEELIAAMDNGKNPVPAEVKRVADGLVYRDFITVGLLLDKLLIKNPAKPGTPESKLKFVADNLIYVQESDVKLGRIQIFNNWSPYLVADPEKVWIGLEYFATEGDEMWRMPDADFIKFAIAELDKIDVARPDAVRDSVVFHIKKAYPAYFGTYGEFNKIREFVDPVENLFLMGRNGMHKYNNMDHSMLAAMEVVKCIRENSTDKTALWNVNSEEDYHEGKK
jgi:protoporphyrinogen oxidase